MAKLKRCLFEKKKGRGGGIEWAWQFSVVGWRRKCETKNPPPHPMSPPWCTICENGRKGEGSEPVGQSLKDLNFCVERDENIFQKTFSVS